MSRYPDAFIREIPKTDLHVHLDGSLRLSSLIEMAEKGGVGLPSYTEEGLRELVFKESYADLPEYLGGFAYTCAVLRDLENLERAAYELAMDNIEEGVCYIEPRFAPQLLMDNRELTMDRVLVAVDNGLRRAKAEYNARPEVGERGLPPFDYGIIVCAMRMFGASGYSPYYDAFFGLHRDSAPAEVIKMAAVEVARGVVRIRDRLGVPIVGFDIAGQEAGHPAGQFREAFDYVHENFMHKTVHAGEAYGAESIFQAITDLHADRLGHGYFLFDVGKVADPGIDDKREYVERLANFIADRRVTIEVCLTSNLQTNPTLRDLRRHSLGRMLEHRLSTTLCTDNRLVSNTTVSKEIRLAVENFDIGPKALKNMIVYGFKRSFYPGPYAEKRNYVRRLITRYEAVARKYGIEAESE
ncbi:MAG: adenosine deaminase family protein [Spirochaetes bacterium]|nr:adenosine deaminase family protein [Spirochaetota bacterium]MBU1081146.1 adenosine deaminase family protein [Spirochaetota bacterium]